MKRIMIIVNKQWEAEPILSAMLSYKIKSPALINPTILNYPWVHPQGTVKPRAVWEYTSEQVIIELWCIQDLMDPKWHSSSSEGKVADLPKAFTYRPEKPILVIACGTAGYYDDDAVNQNGSVVVGCDLFIHNYHPSGENPLSKWDDPQHFEKIISSTIGDDFFNCFDQSLVSSIEQRLLKPFLNPSSSIQLVIKKDIPSLCNVNITDSKDYLHADIDGIQLMKKNKLSKLPGSVETTHGVTRLMSDAPYAFISGITDRAGYFEEDVNGKDLKGNIKREAQNYTASFNIGVCLAWLIPKIAGIDSI